MKIGHTIDSNGFYTGDVLSDSEETPDVAVFCPDGFYKPKWNGSAWVEGITAQEIHDILNRPVVETADQKEIDQLRAQLSQQNDQNTAFMEFVLSTMGVE